MFSGLGGDETIGRMDDSGQWTKAGQLNRGRYGHNVIFDGQYIIVVGGELERDTERCQLQNGAITCTTQEPKLNYYYLYPELFLVPDAFCKG